MAIIPETEYPGKIKPASNDYPYGEAQDVTSPGDGTGTPWKASNLNDIYGHHQALLSEAGEVPSGSPEKATASQYLQSSSKVHGAEGTLAKLAAGKYLVGTYVKLAERGGSTWLVTAGGTADTFTVLDAGGGNTAVFQPLNGTITPTNTGAGRDEADYTAQVQAADDFALANNIQFTGDGTYFLGSGVNLSANFSSVSGMKLEPIVGFAGDYVVDIVKAAYKGFGLSTRNGNGVANLQGIILTEPRIKLQWCDAIGFEYGFNPNAWSQELFMCSGINGGTGVSAWAPATNKEINVLRIIGGEYYGNSDYALNIGDERRPTSVPPGVSHGTSIDIEGPTCDQGVIKLDSLIRVKVSAHLERNPATHTAAIELGGSVSAALKNVTVAGCYFSDYPYAVQCLNGVEGLVVENNQMRAVSHCGLVLTTDQFKYTYRDNSSTGSFGSGQPVMTGVRSALQPQFGSKTVDVYGLYNGAGAPDSEHLYPFYVDDTGSREYRYSISRDRYYRNPTENISVTVAGNVITFDTPAEASAFNGGDSVAFVGTGGAVSYIRSVDYINGTAIYDSAAWSGAGTLSQRGAAAVVEGTYFELPTDGIFDRDVANGSRMFNTGTVTPTPAGWTRVNGAWVAM